jgi:hypothetical protein
VIETEKKKQFILTWEAWKCFIENVPAGFNNYSIEETIFFNAWASHHSFLKPFCWQNECFRFFSALTKSLDFTEF